MTNNSKHLSADDKQKQPVKGEVDPKDSFSKSTMLARQYAAEVKQKKRTFYS